MTPSEPAPRRPRAGRLLRLGFADADGPRWTGLAALGEAPASRCSTLLGRHRRPRPRAAPAGAARRALVASDPDRAAMLHADRRRRGHRASGCSRVLGASEALGDHLVRHPDHWTRAHRPHPGLDPARGVRRARGLLAAVGADPHAAEPVASRARPDGRDALRVAYRRVLLGLAARDLAHDLGVDDAAAELADLATATLDAALAIARPAPGRTPPRWPARRHRHGQVRRPRAQLRLRRRRHLRRRAAAGPDGEVDDTASLRAATRLAATLIRICSEHTAEGTIWPVDAELRPEGKAGRWCAPWPATSPTTSAGPRLGVPGAAQGPPGGRRPRAGRGVRRGGLAHGVGGRRARRTSSPTCRPCAAAWWPPSRPSDADRELKLGPGGLRDVEFAVQLLQLVHGRTDPGSAHPPP